MTVLRTLAVACVGGWLGIMAFFSFAVAPLAFRVIARDAAGQVVAAALPRYYAWGAALCGIALAALLALALLTPRRRWRRAAGAALCAVMIALCGWAWANVLPRAEAARRARDDTAFAATHRQAVRLNLLTMLAGAGVLCLEGLRRNGRRAR